jgi:Arc/MetJ-type ribon-helix-helix transcriptional regulator
MAAKVRARVASGRYATEREVVLEALRALDDHEMTVEEWLSIEVIPVLDAMEADPSRGRSIEEVRASMAAAFDRAEAA